MARRQASAAKGKTMLAVQTHGKNDRLWMHQSATVSDASLLRPARAAAPPRLCHGGGGRGVLLAGVGPPDLGEGGFQLLHGLQDLLRVAPGAHRRAAEEPAAAVGARGRVVVAGSGDPLLLLRRHRLLIAGDADGDQRSLRTGFDSCRVREQETMDGSVLELRGPFY